MFQMNPLARAIARASIVSSLIFLLAACGEDGDDGINGTDGAAGVDGSDGTDGVNGQDGVNGSTSAKLTRIATVPLGAEVTGMFLTEEGDLFFNAQHPDSANTAEDSKDQVFASGTVGVLEGVNFNNLPETLIETPVPVSGSEEEQLVKAAYGTYKVLGQSGETYGGALPQGLGITLTSDGVSTIDENYNYASQMPDFNGYVPTGSGEGYLFSNWESYPGAMSRLAISKDSLTGEWEVDTTDVMMLDFGDYGTVANCFGSVSPWGTPLTSEEWGNRGDNTHEWNDPDQYIDSREGLTAYTDPLAVDSTATSVFPNTYRYHYIVEITEPTSSNPVPVKRYALGRFEHENAIVMPDQKTVYLSQDDTDGVFYKFVADTAADLSSGTLYGAKLTQDAGLSDPAVTGFDIEWIELAAGEESEIEGWIAEYDAIDTDDYVDGKSSYLTDSDAIAWAAGDSNYPSYSVEYQAAIDAGYDDENTFGGAVTAGAVMDDRIVFLESRKAARAKGATAEWRKFEGIYVNQKRAQEAVEGIDLVADEEVEEAYVYFAISDIDRGMIDGEGDIRLSDRVKDCGGVYRMALEADYNVSRIEPAIMGATAQSSLSSDEECSDDQLSQPDNVFVMDDGRVLIGEDGGAKNNAMWIFEPGS